MQKPAHGEFAPTRYFLEAGLEKVMGIGVIQVAYLAGGSARSPLVNSEAYFWLEAVTFC
jgi:hypothetical protein